MTFLTKKRNNTMIELNDLIDSKIYVKNNVSFMPAKDIIDPWLNAISYADQSVRIAVQNPVINENKEGSTNAAYPRYLVEVFDGMNPQNSSEYGVQGIIVAMDNTMPIIKLYSGMNAKACTNLSIWGADYVYTQNLLTDLKPVWKTARKYFEEATHKYMDSNIAHSILSLEIDNNQVNRLLGDMLRKAQFNKLGTGPIVQAAKRLSDKNSSYYFNPKESTTLENVYQSITQSLTNSNEIITIPEKTLLVYDMIRNN